jgi:prepilin-type N-terminal cleavage/methylation domain
MNTASGMTLVELLVTVTLVAILLAIGLPSYQGITTTNRMAAEMNALVGDLQYTRSEAVKQGQTVTICASTNGTSCSGSANWANGWMIFADANGNQAVNTGESRLRLQTALGSTDTLQSHSSTALQAITFNRNGFSSNTGSVTLNDASGTTDRRQCVLVSTVGNVKLQSGAACP